MHIFGQLVHIFGQLVHIFGKLVQIFARKFVSRTSKQVLRNLGPLWQPGVYNDTKILWTKRFYGHLGVSELKRDQIAFENRLPAQRRCARRSACKRVSSQARANVAIPCFNCFPLAVEKITYLIDLLMGLFRGAVFRHGGGALKQPIKQPTEMPTSTLALMGRFRSLMGRFPTLMGAFHRISS